MSDSDLAGIVQNGISGTGMPAFASLGAEKVKVLVDYLRTLQGTAGKRAEAPVSGDVHSGESLFFGKAQCSACHLLNGKGGFIASDLSLYGSRETAERIRAVIANPKDNLPERANPTTVVTRTGRKFTGMLRSTDNFSLALQTPDGSFQFFQRSDLSKISTDARPLMPGNYASTLTSAEIDDLIKYLLAVGTENASHAPRKPERADDDDDAN